MWPGAARGNHPNSAYARPGPRGEATSAGHLLPETGALCRGGGARAHKAEGTYRLILVMAWMIHIEGGTIIEGIGAIFLTDSWKMAEGAAIILAGI